MQLVLDTYRISLSHFGGMFEISRKDEATKRFSPEEISNILISKGVRLSSDALLLAMEQEIDVVFIDRGGQPKGRIWNNRFGSIAAIRRKQIHLAQIFQGWNWVLQTIRQKIQNQIAFVQQIAYSGLIALPLLNKTVARMDYILIQIKNYKLDKDFAPNRLAATLRGWEGTASKHYFRLLSEALPALYQFDKRGKRPAQDYFNASLNYLYGILYTRIEGALIKAGVDTSLGIMQADEYNRPVLVYDFIEPYRIWAKRVAFRLCQQYAFSEKDFVPHEGGLWLAGTGKYKVVSAFNEYMEEVIPHNNRQRSRISHIQLDAREFAQMILKLKIE